MFIQYNIPTHMFTVLLRFDYSGAALQLLHNIQGFIDTIPTSHCATKTKKANINCCPEQCYFKYLQKVLVCEYSYRN